MREKFFSIICAFSLLINSLFPIFSVGAVYAEDSTGSATVTSPSPAASEAPSPSPSIEPTDIPTPLTLPDPTPTPIINPSPETSPEPIVSTIPSTEPENTPTPTPDENIGQPNAPPEESPSPSETPQPSPSADIEQVPTGHIFATILENTDADSLQLDLSTQNDVSSATLTTDKGDYAPTDTVVISGSDFLPDTTYTLVISSSDPPAVNFQEDITTNDQGSFIYSYQLDGTYRPNYLVELKDESGNLVASTTFTDSVSSTTTLNDIACVQDQPNSPSGLNCTANDISLASVSGITINGHGCRFPGDTVNFTADWQIQSNATARYNVGLWFATAGQSSALSGTCSGTSLPSSPPPFFDGGAGTCGDINSGSTGTLSITMTATCNPDSNGLLKLPYCTTWQQNNNAACTGPTDAVPGTSSKCNCQDGFTVPITVPPSIEVVKSLDPVSDSGLFNLQVNSTTYAANVGNGGSTGKQTATIGNNTIGETNGTGTSLSDYTSSVVCKDGHGTGNVVSTTGTNPWSLTVANAQDILCTITNTRNTGLLTVIKHVIGTDPASSWTMHVKQNNVDSVTPFAGAENPGTTKSLNIGTYNVSESAGPNGYTLSYSGDCDAQGNVTVSSGQASICTLTNTRDTGTLRVIKDVINDNNGTKSASDFTLHVKQGSTDVTGSPAAGSATGTVYTLNTGSYIVSENTPPTGYTQTGFSGDCDSLGNVTVEAGVEKTCTITNDDIQPKLTVTKVVVNDNGGTKQVSDFPLFVDQTSVTSGVQNGFDVGTYVVSETGDSGYTEAISGDCNSNTGSITLNPGDVKSCTITNNDIGPTLTLVKTVVNNNGGSKQVSDFVLKIDGNQVTSGTANAVNAGLHTATEVNLPGYSPSSWGGDCAADGTITLALGDNKTCTITNDDDAPTLHLLKTITNDNGGTASIADWTLTATGTGGAPTNLSGTTPVKSGSNFKADTYALAEVSGPSGYTAGAWDCEGGTMVDSTHVTVALGESAVCTINNNDNAPSLTLNKVVIKDDGGTAVGSDWILAAAGPTGFSGVGPSVSNGASFDAGTYDLSESGGSSGYTASDWVCTGGIQVDGDTVTVALGQTVTCTITNNDQEGTLIVKKIVINDNGGTLNEDDFSFKVNNGSPVAFEDDGQNDLTVNAGTYTVTEPSVTGYATTYDNCSSVVIANGGIQTCTITNDDIAPTIVLNKVVNTNYGGQAGANDFGLSVGGVNVNSGQTATVLANTAYAINEAGLPGYSFVSITGEGCPTIRGGSVTLTPGQNIICTITNEDEAAHLIVHKVTDPSDTTTLFSITALGSETITTPTRNITGGSSVDYTVDAGTYSVSEADLAEWDETGNTCTNISVANGETQECTITNTQRGHVIIIKDAIPNNAQDFTFNNNFGLGNPVTVTLDDDGNNGNGFAKSYDATVTAGTYAVTEDEVAGWKLSSASCDDGSPVNSIDVSPGETVTCTFINKKLGTIILNKNTIGGDGTFDFVMTGQSLPASAQLTTTSGSSTQAFNNIDPENTYSINETDPTGWNLTSVSCQNETDNGSITPRDNTNFTITNGGTVTCTFENTKKGSITIIKDAIPDNSQNFSYSTTGSGLTNFDLDDDADETLSNNKTFNNLEPGSYSITENSADGWDLTNVSCNTGEETNLETGTVSITLSPGENVTCTFTNTKRGHLIVQKTTVPGGEPDLFSIQVTGSGTIIGSTSALISDAQNAIFTVTPGTYSVTEDFLTGWDETANTCQDVQVPAGQAVFCEITNTRRGEIIIEKQTDPDGAEQTFEFESDYDDNFFLSDGELNHSGLLEPGIYSVSELTLDTDGWDLTDTSCTDGSDPGSIDLSPGETVTCTFTNTREEGRIRIEKIIDADGNLETIDDQTPGVEWIFDVNGTGEDTSDPASDLTNENGLVEFDSLKTGEYEVIETVQPGYHIISASCLDEEEESETGQFNGEDRIEGVEVNSNEEVRCTFINTRDTGTITILKNIDNNEDGDTNDEGDVRGAENWTWNILDGDQDIATGQTKTLPTGNYTITEDQQDSYELLGWTCSNEQTGTENSIAIEVTKDSETTCTFTNQLLPPVLTLTKANNRTGIDVSAGADVLYTLTVTLTGSPLSNVSLIDLPPAGFKYRLGSWTAVSSERGDLKPEITTEPTYASPGTWSLGDMVTGETVTLTYIADIDTTTDPGLYKDLAWSSGEGQTSSTVLANESSGFFVGTEVNVVAGSGDSAGVNVVREERGEVLGVSTELPQTGINTLWSVLAVLLLASGAGLIFAGISLRRKYE